ncbi:MAG: host-nuclease inhibitor Gam family protein [Planctomycetota bacterium]
MKTIDAIESTEELDAALAVVGDFDAAVAVANANLDQAIAAVRTEHEVHFKQALESGEAVPIVELRENLVGLIGRYCDKHRKTLLQGDKKSVDLNHGVIGWRKKRDAVVDLVVTEDDKAKGLLAKAYSLLVAAAAVLKLVLGKLPISNFLKVEVKWDKPQILKAFKEKKVTALALSKQGLEVQLGADEFYCEPKSEKRTA